MVMVKVKWSLVGCMPPSDLARAGMRSWRLASPLRLSPQHRADVAVTIMACFEGQADVLSIAPHTLTLAKRGSPLPLAAQDAADTLDAVRGLFAAPEDASLRPAKRRKLNKDNAAVAQSAAIDERESLLLAKVSLELVGGCAALTRALADGSSSFPLSRNPIRSPAFRTRRLPYH
jgi:hypothetical protein